MLNISAAPQIKSSTDNPIALSGSGSGDKQEPATEEFAKVLQREVSETTNKRETNNIVTTSESSENTTSPEDSETAAATTTDTPNTPSTDNLIHSLFMEATRATGTDTADRLLLPLDPTSNPGTLMATSMLSVASSTLAQNPLIPQDNKQATGPASLVNQILQQRFTQTTSATNNLTYSPDDLWQSLDMADSAAYGKLLPFSSEMSETIQINTGESIFSTPNESIATQSFGLSSTSSVTSMNTPSQNVQVDLPVGQPKWGGEFAQKIVWLTSQQNQVAEIHLNPAHLGPVEVTLSIMQDQATAQFSSPHLAVREAIEAALPRLREMMAESGIQLGNVMVGADSFQQENKQQQAFHSAKGDTGMIGTRTETTGQIETTALTNRHNGIVNTYA
ncbi:MAG: flagellar hook-length control protein FliK [Nitrosomonas sp.]|nr:flagellar hook-length control protein FliK [Nitrosomonas sp.]